MNGEKRWISGGSQRHEDDETAEEFGAVFKGSPHDSGGMGAFGKSGDHDGGSGVLTSYRYCIEECLHDLNITGIMKDFAQRIQNYLVSS